VDSALIISNAEKGAAVFIDLLAAASINQIVTLKTVGEARRLLLERDFDLILINSPLKDETGERFSREVASNGNSQVIFVVKSEFFDAVSDKLEDEGVLTIAKPIHKTVFWSALKFANAAQNRLKRERTENNKLRKKIEDIRIVDRAKCILISHMNVSEDEAHKYIEKQAMDARTTKRAIAEGILKTYEML